MTDLSQLTRSIGVKGDAHRTFRLTWQYIHGPESDVDTVAHRQLRDFVDDLAYKITQDCAVITPLEVRLRLVEGEATGQDEHTVKQQGHWMVTLESLGFAEQSEPNARRRTLSTMAVQHYIARQPQAIHLSYCGYFRVGVEVVFPFSGGAQSSQKETIDRLIRLIVGAYQQEIYQHYPEWTTDYINTPVINGGVDP